MNKVLNRIVSSQLLLDLLIASKLTHPSQLFTFNQEILNN